MRHRSHVSVALTSNMLKLLFYYEICLMVPKPLPDPMRIYHRWCSVRAISQLPMNFICKMRSEIAFLRLHKIITHFPGANELINSGQMTHICVRNRRQAIICTNATILLFWTSGTNFSEILCEVHTFSFNKMRLNCRLRNGGNFILASMS